MMPETSFKPLPRAFALLALALLAMCALGGMMASEEVDADLGVWDGYGGDDSTADNPYTGINIVSSGTGIPGLPGNPYVKVGSSINLVGCTNDGPRDKRTVHYKSVSSGFGLTLDTSGDTSITGTTSKTGDITLTYHYIKTGTYASDTTETRTIHVIGNTTNVPVTSISISGASSVNAGSSITLSASVSPSNATDKSVTWSVQSGSSYVTISSNGTSCTVTGKAAGSATIKCTANDGSGVSATKTITVGSSGPSLPDGVSSGSGTSSDPYVFNLSAGTNYSLKVQPVGQFTSYGAVSDPVTVPGMTFSTAAGGSVTTLTSLSGGQLGAMTISGTPTTNGTWDINATNPSATKYYRIVVTGGNNGFTLHYDANGGSGAPSDATYTSSSSTYTAKVSSVKPTRDGHAFLGWSKSSTAATATYQSGANITLSPGTTTLYAVWQEVKQDWFAYLYYNANGGSGAPSTQSDSINAASPSGSKTFTISSAKPTKSGFDFKGWSENSAATTPSYQPGGTISVPYDSAKTLYAVWQERSYTCHLYFDANGGSGAPPTMTYTGSSTSAHTFTIPSTEPEWAGHEFKGWSESSSASSASYQPGSTISVPYNGSKTLYAVWREMGSDAVDRGIITNGAVIQIVVNERSKMIITAARDHGAYMTAISGESWVVYDTERGTGIVFAEPTVLGTYDFMVRVWIPGLPDSADISYTLEVVNAITPTQDWFAYLHYNANGGAGAPTTQSDSINAASPSGSKTFTISSTKPTRSGFIFKGWAESSSATTPSYQPGGTISVPYDSSKILYAVWEEAKLTITSEPATKSLKVGQTWSYTPTANVSGFTVTVTGADWLSVSNGKISGTPTVKGSYNITVTVSKTGYTSDSQSFVVKVYSALGFESEPGADGIIAYVK